MVTRDGKHRLRLRAADVYIWAFLLAGAAVLYGTAANWQSPDRRQFFAYLLTVIVASALKVKLAGVEGTMSVGFLFVLIGILDLSIKEAIVIAVVSAVVQTLWRPAWQIQPIKVCWNASSISVAVYTSGTFYVWARQSMPEPLALALFVAMYFATHVGSIAGVIALTESKHFVGVFKQQYWLLAYYCCGTSVAWLIGTMPRSIQWEVPIICLPLIYITHRSHAKHVAHIAEQRRHVEEINALQLRTVEALAMAIDARDHETHGHLERVQVYALEIGRELGLDESEFRALRAAALLHDIGKLAVPEQILSKPGRLTPAEFERIKTHSVVGAEIVDRVAFPYPVAPIVRGHHEKWNGRGYPDGLKGEQIPIGARILSPVDCLDAIASDRPYHRGLPLEEAMAMVAAEAGTSFDPRVIDVLQRRYVELEAMTRAGTQAALASLPADPQVVRDVAPAAGFARGTADLANLATHIEAAAFGREARTPAGLTHREALAVVELRFETAVPHDAMAFFAERGGVLEVEYAGGAQGALFRKLIVSRGQGLAGWVSENRRAIINGDPSVERGYPRSAVRPLRSALAVPMTAPDGTEGVLGLYRYEAEAFDSADLSALCAVCQSAGFRLGQPPTTPGKSEQLARPAAVN
jgi:putative nucleotidyltransferase with HDIG domain